MEIRIYPTLIDSFNRMLKGLMSEQDLIDRINRVDQAPSEAANKGKAFHKLTEDPTQAKWKKDGKYFYEWWEFRQDVVDEVYTERAGGLHEVYVEKEILIQSIPVTLYGYVDTLKDAIAMDVKTTGWYRGVSYGDSFQRIAYPWITNSRMFRFLITDFNFVFYEDYYPEAQLEGILKGHLGSFIDFVLSGTVRPLITDKRLFNEHHKLKTHG